MVCISVRRPSLWNLLPLPKTSNDRISEMSFLSPALCVLFKGIVPCVAPHSDVPRSWELSHILLQIDLGSVFGGYIFPSQRLFLLCLFFDQGHSFRKGSCGVEGGKQQLPSQPDHPNQSAVNG